MYIDNIYDLKVIRNVLLLSNSGQTHLKLTGIDKRYRHVYYQLIPKDIESQCLYNNKKVEIQDSEHEQRFLENLNFMYGESLNKLGIYLENTFELGETE